jgi:YjjW family glycine radical enzyme activase
VTAHLVVHPIAPAGTVLEVAGTLTYSAVDGPGNRFVLFLQGCNFDCVACHNPSTIGRCDACGACVDVCPHGALSYPEPGKVAWDESVCDRCRACITPCRIDADPAIRLISIPDMVEEIRAVAPFLTGITVTGGEPTMQLDALVDLFAAVKAELPDLTTLVDSNGTLPPRGWERLIPVMDGAMIDLKAASDDLHHEITARSNVPVKESIRLLSERDRLEEVRLLVVPGVTDTEAELSAWTGFVAAVDPDVPVRVMGFRHQGTRERARGWPEATTEDVDRVVDRLRELGLPSVGT